MRKLVDKVNQKPASPDEDVLESVHAIMHLYRSLQQSSLREDAHELAHGLVHMEVKVLGFFARRPGASQSDLVSHSGRDKAQVARLIRGLRERGLLEAQADETDRRSTRLRLSAAGEELFAALDRHSARLSALALAGLSGQEREALLGYLGRVRANLEAAG